MLKLPFIRPSALVLASREGRAEAEASGGTMVNQKMSEFAARYTAAWCSRDPARVASFFSENGSLRINEAEPSTGRAAIAEAARGFMTAFPDLVVSMDALDSNGSGSDFTYRWTLTGTNTGPGGTGRRVRISGREEWTIGRGGLIERSLGHFDEAEYRRQLSGG
jgi:nuclear transport factor 2 (NTF2) superfamily protein